MQQWYAGWSVDYHYYYYSKTLLLLLLLDTSTSDERREGESRLAEGQQQRQGLGQPGCLPTSPE